MNFNNYLKDKFFSILLFIIMYFIVLLMLVAFKVNSSLIVSISITLIFFLLLFLLYDYFRKRTFYHKLLFNIEKLDKSYLVLELLIKPDFYEGEILYQALYEINKSMCENVKNLELQINDFKEYIEMWIHEVKIPLATLILIFHNHRDKYDKKMLNQIKKIEDYTEQVLYYVRSENAEKDYLIRKTNLKKIINQIALNNKDYFLENKIEFKIGDIDKYVLTDSKWLEFIINQVISNSLKYSKKEEKSYIKVTTKEDKDRIVLSIYDNGIGISASDLPRVFEKSFTGVNGRNIANSTGMGLYICKRLCQKLGYEIGINSEIDKYTEVTIIFPKNNYYDVIR